MEIADRWIINVDLFLSTHINKSFCVLVFF